MHSVYFLPLFILGSLKGPKILTISLGKVFPLVILYIENIFILVFFISAVFMSISDPNSNSKRLYPGRGQRNGSTGWRFDEAC